MERRFNKKQVQQSWGVYPDVFAPTDYTFKFLEDVLDEVMQLFPSKYIHIGAMNARKITGSVLNSARTL
jgi:hexosaminidase